MDEDKKEEEKGTETKERATRKVVVVEEETPVLPKMEEKPELTAGEKDLPVADSWKAQLTGNPPSGGPPAGGPKSRFPVALLALISFLLGFLAGITAAYVVLLLPGGKSPSFGETPTQVAVETAAPAPTPAPTPDRALLRIGILNGTGVKGEGARAKAYLTELGYKVTSVDNAANSNYKAAEISISEEKSEYREILKKDLSEKYPVSDKEKVLKDTSTFDAQIIVGKD